MKEALSSKLVKWCMGSLCGDCETSRTLSTKASSLSLGLGPCPLLGSWCCNTTCSCAGAVLMSLAWMKLPTHRRTSSKRPAKSLRTSPPSDCLWSSKKTMQSALHWSTFRQCGTDSLKCSTGKQQTLTAWCPGNDSTATSETVDTIFRRPPSEPRAETDSLVDLVERTLALEAPPLGRGATLGLFASSSSLRTSGPLTITVHDIGGWSDK
mmetsp:Transcript_125607/g.391082  ORF Transcript_125607/g.391082 Transcript_125607/m.391082 type:complete len:210 (+) Transcript_125607:290-919(+)